MINNFLRFCYEQGWSDDIYSGIVIFAFVAQMVFLIFYRKKYRITFLQSILTVVLVYPAAYFWMLVLTWIENGFQNWGANNIVRMYVYAPLICIAAAKLLKIPSGKMIDYLAPSMALQQVIGHSVCPFAGCCHGYECSWGIWNPTTDTYVFPNQWLECMVALIIVLYLLHLAKKGNYVGTGKVYAMFLLTFGGTRFLLEFLRDNDKLFLGISNLALHALFMVLVGTVWLMVLYEKDTQQALKKHRKHS
jgi:prolipoprotein diacylglyceryltransferase